MSPRNKALSEEMRAHSRAALVDAARAVFAEQGYFNCLISDIARRAGMSQGNLYWYFPGKEELLRAVLADGFDNLGEVMANAATGPGSASEKVDALLDGLLSFYVRRGQFNAILLSLLGHGGAVFFTRLGFDMEQIGMGYTRSVSAIVVQGQAEGAVAADFEPVWPVMLFFGLFNGLNLTYGDQWMQIPRETIRTAVFQLLGFKP